MQGSLLLNLSDIIEDPNQPRTIFDKDSLQELANTIKKRGVKSPISVRETDDHKYIINHGARRYRASLMAGLKQIPAIIDNDYTSIDQVIENIQRDNLAPMDIARFIDREIKTGKKRGEIAQELGKSNSWVSQFASLIDLPDQLVGVLESGKVQDITSINELRKLYAKAPDEVMEAVNSFDEISRSTVKDLKGYIEELKKKDKEQKDQAKNAHDLDDETDDQEDKIFAKLHLYFDYHGQKVEYRYKKPSNSDKVIVALNGEDFEVNANELSVLGVDKF